MGGPQKCRECVPLPKFELGVAPSCGTPGLEAHNVCIDPSPASHIGIEGVCPVLAFGRVCILFDGIVENFPCRIIEFFENGVCNIFRMALLVMKLSCTLGGEFFRAVGATNRTVYVPLVTSQPF